LREGHVVFDNHVSTKERIYHKLLELLSFESCIGLPVHLHGEIQYVLFLFHREVNAFNIEDVPEARSIMPLIEAELERDHIETMLRSLNSLIISGQTAAGVLHDISSKISAVELGLKNLSRRLLQ